MARTHRKIQQWNQWLLQFPGRNILTAEQAFLKSLLSKFYGKYALLIGTPQQYNLLNSTKIPSQVLLSPLMSDIPNTYSIESQLHELPIARGSIDLVLLPHILEQVENPHQLLAEACRIVKPEGHIVICGFNPYSLWGLKKWLNKPPFWPGSLLKANQIKEWLVLADFKLIKQATMLFRPPFSCENNYNNFAFLEWLGSKCYAPLGGIYTLIAQAKVIPLTPIKLQWQQELAPVGMFSTINIPLSTKRNSK